MNIVDTGVDLDDGEGLLDADRNGLLRASAMAGAQVRATAAALDEGVLDSLRSDLPPRTVIWVARPGAPGRAGAVLAAAFGASLAAPVIVADEVPPWIGALDVLVVAGDDPGDPTLVGAAATGVHRGARVLVVAPNEGPLRDVAAGRAVSLPPRVWVPDDFGFLRYLAAGMALLHVVDQGTRVDLSSLADELDAEALRNSAARDLFTNPAKTLAERMSGYDVVLSGDTAATVELARHGADMMFRVASTVTGAAGLPDVLAAVGAAAATRSRSLFHDEQIDGPLPRQLRTFVLSADTERHALTARIRGFDDITVIGAGDVPDVDQAAPINGRPEQQLAILALRLEMTAVYLKLVRG